MNALSVLVVAVTLIAAGVCLFRVVSFKGEEFKFRPSRAVLAALILLVGFFGVLPSFGQVPAGQRGVVLQFGATTGEVKQPGLYFVVPFVQSVRNMDVQVHAHKAPAAAASHDLQNVATEVTLNYRLDPAAVVATFRDLGYDYGERIITPATQEAIKAVTAQYNAEQLIVERATVRQQIENMLRERLIRHGIILDAIAITNFEFSKDFAEAIEAKVVAAQTALKAENDLKTAKIEAEQRIAQAEGEARAIQIQAQAITQQGGPEYVKLKAIEKWDGAMPQWITGGGALPFIDVGKVAAR